MLIDSGKEATFLETRQLIHDSLKRIISLQM